MCSYITKRLSLPEQWRERRGYDDGSVSSLTHAINSSSYALLIQTKTLYKCGLETGIKA